MYKEAEEWTESTIGTEEIKRREAAFSKSPNIDDGIYLINKYYYYFKDYEKALFYAKQCINLGVNDTPGGRLVNFWMAVIYKETNRKELASKHLEMALKLDKDNLIQKHNWIEKSGLEDIFAITKAKSVSGSKLKH